MWVVVSKLVRWWWWGACGGMMAGVRDGDANVVADVLECGGRCFQVDVTGGGGSCANS